MIKPKTHRDCAYKPCSKNFKKFKTTDKYCSPQCYEDDNDKSPYNQIANRTPERAKQESLYNKLIKPFLNKEENLFCPVMFFLEGWRLRTSEVHHIQGRKGDRLLDSSLWLAVSSEGHKWIHDNPNLSKQKGWMKNTTL